MIYNPFTCDLMICGGSKEIFRLSLDEGKFYSSLEASIDEINVLEFNKHLNLLISGGDNGVVDIWDYR
jgi:ribosome biogenesis protein ENP2